MNNLELEFALERERRYLAQNPSEASKLAINYLEDFLRLAREIKVLEEKLESVMADNQALTSQLAETNLPKKVVLPSIHRY